MTIKSKSQTIRERYYYSGPLNKGLQFFLEDTEFHHLANVMRAKEGEKFGIVNGKGDLAEAVLIRLEKKKGLFEVQAVEHQEKEKRECILAQALPRINRLDFIVEKGTELGMTELWLFPGETSERKELSSSQFERIVNISIAAMKQCGRLYLPKIVLLPQIAKWQNFSMPIYFGDVHSEAPSFQKLLLSKESKSAIFCTGPESGFTEKEELYLRKLGAEGVKLHPNILRTDTASLTALTLMSQSFF